MICTETLQRSRGGPKKAIVVDARTQENLNKRVEWVRLEYGPEKDHVLSETPWKD